MIAYRNASIVTLIAYIGLLFINPAIVGYIATFLVAVNIVTMLTVEQYAKQVTNELENRKNAELLSALKKLKRI